MKIAPVVGPIAIVFVFLASVSPAVAGTMPTSIDVEAKVRTFFKDTPVMAEIARCESKFRQFTDSGSVLRGGAGGEMVGVFQFYERIHAAGAAALGFDLATLEGNLGYAKHLYETEGTTPWNSARYCWEHAAETTSPNRAELLAKIKELTLLIQELQTKLRAQKRLHRLSCSQSMQPHATTL
jgi:hypothetical protein